MLCGPPEQRNIRGWDRLYVGPGNASYAYVSGLYAAAGARLAALVAEPARYRYCSDGVSGDVMLSKDCVVVGG